MKARSILALIILAFVFSTTVSAEKIIIINETEQQVYALEELLLAGDLATNSLSIRGNGEVISGETVKVYLFGPSSDVLVKNLKVNGKPTSTSFDERGYYFVADEGGFKLSGALDVRTIGQLRLKVPGPVNSLRFDLTNGYAVGGDRYGLYDDEIVVQRVEDVAMLVTGSFKYTYAERDDFYYQIDFKSFGSTLGGYTIDLPNGEVVNSVTGAIKWEQKKNKLVLELTGDTKSVIVSGQFNSNNLRIPLKEDRHHVLIESDPEKKITIQTSARELDVTESPLRPTYGNARAFLASRDNVFYVTVKRLPLLPSLAASVRNARNQIAVTTDGSIVGEAIYSYANTGVDYLPVDVPGTPLYSSTGGRAVKLTKEDKLFLALPKTNHGTLDVLYFTTRGKLKPFDAIKIPIAKTDLPISQQSTSIFLPPSVFVLETLGARGGSELPSVESALIFIVIIGGIGLLLKKNTNFAAYYLVLSVGALALDARIFLLIQAAALLAYIKRKVAGFSGAKYIAAALAVVVVLGILLVVATGFISQLGVFSMGGSGRGTVTYAANEAMMDVAAPAPAFKSMEVVGEGEGAISVPVRKGVLPVKLEIPRMGKSITVTNYLVTKEKPVELTLIVVASWLKYILYLAAVFAAIECKSALKDQ